MKPLPPPKPVYKPPPIVVDLEDTEESPRPDKSPSFPSFDIPDFGDMSQPLLRDENSPAKFSPNLPPVPQPKAATSWSKKLYDEMPPEPSLPVLKPKIPLAAKVGRPATQSRAFQLPEPPSIALSAPKVPPAAPAIKTTKKSTKTESVRSWLKNLDVIDGED